MIYSSFIVVKSATSLSETDTETEKDEHSINRGNFY